MQKIRISLAKLAELLGNSGIARGANTCAECPKIQTVIIRSLIGQ